MKTAGDLERKIMTAFCETLNLVYRRERRLGRGRLRSWLKARQMARCVAGLPADLRKKWLAYATAIDLAESADRHTPGPGP